jgi:phosphoserine aminotransferase
MISFYPGPSQIYPDIKGFMSQAVDDGILSVNHRSAAFVDMAKTTVHTLKQKLHIPTEYQVYFVTSATESWEIIAQSLASEGSCHIFNGAFGQKWYEYTSKLVSNTQAISFHAEEHLLASDTTIAQSLICLTHNETSNGSQLAEEVLKTFRAKYPNKLIAVDATSSMAGVYLPFKEADIWFASVQKCFGLPAGLGLLICSPKSIQKARAIHNLKHYNSLVFLDDMMQKYQTTYTPNVLGIYLLGKVAEMIPDIKITSEKVKFRRQNLETKLSDLNSFDFLISDKTLRSDTVIALKGDPDKVKKIKNLAKEQGLLLGNGYGTWAKNTFRIANFPALQDRDFNPLIDLLQNEA